MSLFVSSFMLLVAAIVVLLFKKLGQPLVLGYLVAGFLVSPYMPYMEALGMTTELNEEIEEVGNLGVLFIMFGLGLEFSFKKLGSMGITPILSALFIICCMGTLGYLVGMMMELSEMNCIFLGGMLCMSSTAIINKAFNDLGISGQAFTSKVMSVLILEDIIAIVLLVMLSAKAKGTANAEEILNTIIELAEFVAISLIAGLLVLPWFFRMIRKMINEEMLLIISVALLGGMAYLSESLGFNSAFGAFIIGSILAETHEARSIEHVTLPIKNYLGALFFISVGMMVKIDTVVDFWAPIATLCLTIMLGQAIFGTTGFFIGGQSLKDSFRSGFSMSQIGEFSFIIAGLGVSTIQADGNPAINPDVYPVIVAVSVITTFFTPYMIRAAEPCYNIFSKIMPSSVIEKYGTNERKKKESNGKQGFFAKFWGKIFANAKKQTGNLPTYFGESFTVSQVVVAEGDLFVGKNRIELHNDPRNPFEPLSLIPSGELDSWIDLTPEYVFKPGDKVCVINKM